MAIKAGGGKQPVGLEENRRKMTRPVHISPFLVANRTTIGLKTVKIQIKGASVNFFEK